MRALEQAERVIAAITPDRLTQPTPCTDWDVRELLTHLVLVARRIAVVGQGRPGIAAQREQIPDGRVVEEFHKGREEAVRAWADDASLTRVVEVPFGRMPGAVVLGAYLPEAVAHTWDLWTAASSTITLDPGLAEAALTAARRAIPAARDGFPFGPVVEVPAYADAYTRLAGWMGRDPDWRDRTAAE